MRYIFFILIFLFLPAMAQQAIPTPSDTTLLFHDLSKIAHEKSSLIDSLNALQAKQEAAETVKLKKHTYKVYYRVPHVDGSIYWWVFHYKIKGTDTLFQRVTKYKEKW